MSHFFTFQYASNLFLNELTDGDSTTESGSEFQQSTTRCEKKFALLTSLDLCLNNFRLLPRRDVDRATVKKVVGSTFSLPVKIL